MYNEQQAKNGFKTFIVTLSVSLLLFGALYYVITDFSDKVDIESSTTEAKNTLSYNSPEVKGTASYSVFGEMTNNTVNEKSGVVLAETTETDTTTTETEESTSATVPDTGSEQIAGMVLAVGSLSMAAYVLLVGPRKLALSAFEKDATS